MVPQHQSLVSEQGPVYIQVPMAGGGMGQALRSLSVQTSLEIHQKSIQIQIHSKPSLVTWTITGFLWLFCAILILPIYGGFLSILLSHPQNFLRVTMLSFKYGTIEEGFFPPKLPESLCALL